MARSGRPGRGGIDRGRGDANLDFTGSTKEAKDASKPERLPPGAARPAPSILLGVSRAEPQGKAVRDTGAGSAGAEGFGAAAWRRRIVPRHRDAVRGFFDSDAPAATPPAKDPVPAASGGK